MKYLIKKQLLTVVLAATMVFGAFAPAKVALAAGTAASAVTSAAATSKSTGTVSTAGQQTEASYVLNTNTKKFHYPSCKDVKKIKPENYETSSLSRDDIIAQGYSSCGHCHP